MQYYLASIFYNSHPDLVRRENGAVSSQSLVTYQEQQAYLSTSLQGLHEASSGFGQTVVQSIQQQEWQQYKQQVQALQAQLEAWQLLQKLH